MDEISFHDFIIDYPCQNDDDIQWKTACRKEFNQLASKAKKNLKYNNFFYHQELLLRYIRQYDRILNIQATGTGKTGSLINVAEFYKKNKKEGIKRIYVIEPGPPTVEDFKSQIKKLSNPEDYVSPKSKMTTNTRIERSNISRLIKEWYSVITYGDFCKNMLSDQDIVEYYSDCVFFFDEAHKMKKLEDDKGTELSEDQKKQVYQYIWRVTHLTKRSKIIVASATPMINYVSDMVPLINLLLPEDQQFPEYGEKDYQFYDSLSIDQLEPYFRGKITYIKFMESNLNIRNQGRVLDYNHSFEFYDQTKKEEVPPILPWKRKIDNNSIVAYERPSSKKQILNVTKTVNIESQVKITMVEMSGIQLEVYKRLVPNKSKFGSLEKTKGKNSFFSKELEASTFVFPNGMIGGEGFRYYTFKDKYNNVNFKKKVDNNTPSLKKYIRVSDRDENDIETIKRESMQSLRNIKDCSSKFYFYLNKEINEGFKPTPGCSFCYLEFVDASGVILLGLILSRFGYEEYKDVASAFDYKSKKILIDKRPRYALLTGKTANIQNILELFNSEENKNGEYIQMIIASKLARDGINIKNVVRGYIMTPGWHESGTYQALSRFIRADSHDYLLKDSEEKIAIDIYRLASTVPNEEENIQSYGDKGASVDTYLYLLSERKDIRIKRIFRFMKQLAFDAYLNYERNTAGRSLDYTAANDYSVKKFTIWEAEKSPGNKVRKGLADNQGPDKEDYVYNTYHILYGEELKKEIKNIIINILSTCYIISYEKLFERINSYGKKYDQYFIDYIIEDLVFNQYIIYNAERTIIFRIVSKNNKLYILRENFLSKKDTPSENLIYIDTPYPDISEKTTKSDDSIMTEDIYKNIENKTKEEFIEMCQTELDYSYYKLLLEDSLIRYKNNQLMEINNIILDVFKYYWLLIPKPEGYLKAAKIALSDVSKKGQGRKRKEGSKAGLKDIDYDKIEIENNDQEMVFVHFYKETSTTGFDIASIFETLSKSIQVLDYDSEEFREANNEEDSVYNYLFNKNLNQIMEQYKKSNYYATYIYRGDRKEKNKEKIKESFFRIVDNTNVKNRGRNCNTLGEAVLTTILQYLDTDKEYQDKKFKNKRELCKVILSLFKSKKLVFESP